MIRQRAETNAIDSRTDMDLLNACKRILESDDVPTATALFKEQPGLLEQIGKACGSCMPSPLIAARSREMVDLLIENGAKVSDVSESWAPGFGLEKVVPEVAEYLIERGATVTPHAAAAMGLTESLCELLDANRDLVHAKGGDGCRPLHFARNVEIARLLLDRGAEIDARDDDHDSTPAQWRIGDAPEVTRFLLERGATPDIFMAAALGDLALAECLIHENPLCTTYRIGNNKGPFPGIGFQGRGGTIYQWTLGFNQSPHEIALKRGHRNVFDLLMKHTPPRHQFLVACTLADRPAAEELAARHPGIINELDDEDRALLAKFCWETNINIEAVRLMLDLGFSVDAPESNHGCTPLHNAAWCGNPELVGLLIQRGHPVDVSDPQYHATPVGWAIHSCVEARRHPEGDFPKVVELLLQRGASFDERRYPTDHEGIDAVLKRHLGK